MVGRVETQQAGSLPSMAEQGRAGSDAGSMKQKFAGAMERGDGVILVGDPSRSVGSTHPLIRTLFIKIKTHGKKKETQHWTACFRASDTDHSASVETALRMSV